MHFVQHHSEARMMGMARLVATVMALAFFTFAAPVIAVGESGGNNPMQEAAGQSTVEELLKDKRPAAELSRKELAARIQAARTLIKSGGLSRDAIKQLRQMIKADREARRQGKDTKADAAQVEGGDEASAQVSGAQAAIVAADIKNPSISLAGKPELVFDYSKFRCKKIKRGGRVSEDGNDTPDASASAYRRDDGQVVLLASNNQNYEFVGPTLESVKRTGDGGDCKHLLKSPFNPDPAAFDGKQWLVGAYKTASGEFLGFVHNEYHGELYTKSDVCKRGQGATQKCWLGSSLIVVSTDGGQSFHRSEKYSNLLATPPFVYQPGMGRVGYFSPRVVRGPNTTDKSMAVFVLALSSNPKIRTTKLGKSAAGQVSASCLYVGSGPDPSQWRGWNGKEFSVTTIDPYKQATTDGEHYCEPVVNFLIRSVRYVPSKGLYIAIGTRQSANRKTADVVYAVSKNLTSWSAPAVLMRIESLNSWKPGDGEAPTAYHSLLDPSSTSVNFDTIEERPYLYYTRYNVANGRVNGSTRSLERVALKIDWP